MATVADTDGADPGVDAVGQPGGPEGVEPIDVDVQVERAEVVESATVLNGDGRLLDPSVRRWTAAGTVTAVAVFWMLGTLGRPWRLFAATNAITSNFFDLQAHSLMHGRISVPSGSLFIEEFVTSRGAQMYFGIVPAVLRIPVHAVIDGLDSRLNVASCLIAAALACVATARLARRAQRQLGLGEAGGRAPSARWYGLIAASPVLFSPFLYLGARSMVYYEAIAWGAAGTLWAVDAAMQWWYVGGRRHAAVLLVATTVAINSRVSVGAAPIVMLLLLAGVAGWQRRWRPAVVAVAIAVVAFGSNAAVNQARFDQLVGAPMQAQKAYDALPEQREAVALTGGSLESVRFLPTTLTTYFNPLRSAARPTRLFPFVAFGSQANVLFDEPMQTAPVGTVPTSMPLFVALGSIGAYWVARRGDAAWRAAAIGGAVSSLTTLCFWAVAHRYIVDFVPLAVLLSAPGLWLAWRWLIDMRARSRRLVLAGAASVVLVAMVGQMGLTLWTRFFFFLPDRTEQSAAVAFRYRLDDFLVGGTPPNAVVVAPDTVPLALPRPNGGTVMIAGDCDAIYGTGLGWQALERRSGGDRRKVVVAAPATLAVLATEGRTIVNGEGWRIESRPDPATGGASLAYIPYGSYESVGSLRLDAISGVVLDVVADPFLSTVQVIQDGRVVLDARGPAGAMRVEDGWDELEGRAPLCEPILRRVRGGDR